MTGMAQVIVDVTNVNDNVPVISDPVGECYVQGCCSLYTYCAYISKL